LPTLLFSIEFSDYGAAIVLQLSLRSLHGRSISNLQLCLKPLLLNVNKDLYLHGKQQIKLSKCTVNVILTYFNNVAYTNLE